MKCALDLAFEITRQIQQIKKSMEIIYKYCGKYGLKALENLELKITPPNQFNDPFEFTPKMTCSDPVRYATRTLERESTLQILYGMCLSDGKFSGSFEKFKQVAKQQNSEWVKHLAEAPQHTLPLLENEFVDEVSKQFGVLCMSEKRDSILMWGHYCDRPQGLVIGFDKSLPIFHQGKGLKPVNYVKSRVTFDCLWEDRTTEMEKYTDEIVFSKSDEWIYEKELRQFFFLSSLAQKTLDNGITGYFLGFQPDAIASVTLGPRCSPELENDVIEILRKSCFSNVKLERAVLHKDDFAMEFEQLN